MTLAMVRPSDISSPNFRSDAAYISSRHDRAASLLAPKLYGVEVKTPKVEAPKQQGALLGEDLTKAENSSSPGIFLLFQRNADEANQGNLLTHVQFGFGQIWHDESVVIRGKNGTAWQEPGCGYLKATFSF